MGTRTRASKVGRARIYTAKLIDDKATKRIEIHCAKIPRDIRYKVRARRRRRMAFERETVGRVNTFERVE